MPVVEPRREIIVPTLTPFDYQFASMGHAHLPARAHQLRVDLRCQPACARDHHSTLHLAERQVSNAEVISALASVEAGCCDAESSLCTGADQICHLINHVDALYH